MPFNFQISVRQRPRAISVRIEGFLGTGILVWFTTRHDYNCQQLFCRQTQEFSAFEKQRKNCDGVKEKEKKTDNYQCLHRKLMWKFTCPQISTTIIHKKLLANTLVRKRKLHKIEPHIHWGCGFVSYAEVTQYFNDQKKNSRLYP